MADLVQIPCPTCKGKGKIKNLLDESEVCTDCYQGTKTVDRLEQREHTRRDGPSTMGRTVVYITCPFCKDEVRAYLWSLSGGGKVCTCGAKHASFGVTIRRKSRSA